MSSFDSPETREAVPKPARDRAHATRFWRGRSWRSVRVPVRVKIAFPFALLAVLFAIAAVYVVSQVVVDSIKSEELDGVEAVARIAALAVTLGTGPQQTPGPPEVKPTKEEKPPPAAKPTKGK